MSNKKSWLSENLGKIIGCVLAFSLIFYVAYSVYKNDRER